MRANNAILGLGAGGGVTIHAALAAGAVDVIVDVVGYFR